MSELGDELTRLLTTGQVPRDVDEAAWLFGRSEREQNPAIVKMMMGLEPTAPRPPKRTGEGRQYDALYRSLLRYRRGQRDPSRSRRGRDFLERFRELARGQITGANVRRARREGLKMRLRAVHRVSKKRQTSTMPADAGGAGLWLFVEPGDDLDEILDLWLEDADAAGDELEALFFMEYEMPEPDELQYEWIELRFGDEEGRQWHRPL